MRLVKNNMMLVLRLNQIHYYLACYPTKLEELLLFRNLTISASVGGAGRNDGCYVEDLVLLILKINETFH